MTDTKSFTQSQSFDIIQPTQLRLIVVQKIKPSCEHGADGLIQVAVQEVQELIS